MMNTIEQLEKRVDRLERNNDEVIRRFTKSMDLLNDTMKNIQSTMVVITDRLIETEKVNHEIKNDLNNLTKKVDNIEKKSLKNKLKSLLRLR